VYGRGFGVPATVHPITLPYPTTLITSRGSYGTCIEDHQWLRLPSQWPTRPTCGCTAHLLHATRRSCPSRPQGSSPTGLWGWARPGADRGEARRGTMRGPSRVALLVCSLPGRRPSLMLANHLSKGWSGGLGHNNSVSFSGHLGFFWVSFEAWVVIWVFWVSFGYFRGHDLGILRKQSSANKCSDA
jgi:hypothetical protein